MMIIKKEIKNYPLRIMPNLNQAYQKNRYYTYTIHNIDNAEDVDIVIPMQNLLEYSKNYSMTTGNLLDYYRHERNDDPNGNNLIVIG